MVYYQLRMTVCLESGHAHVRRTALIANKARICQIVLDYKKRYGDGVFFHLNTIEPSKGMDTGFQPIHAFNAFELPSRDAGPLNLAA
ncbi:MAG: hypothetical protein R3194_02655 [Limnobacter sp.]|nr:hypothetical protein [Limnobacter sp.]